MQNIPKQKIGIMGGTFDPIHYGHLVIAEFARVQFDLDEVIFVPAKVPPHKHGYKVTKAECRFHMVDIAIKTNPYFSLSRVELDRPGTSFSVDTLKTFRAQFGDDTEINFIVGADTILEIMTWKNVDEVMQLCGFLAATRPGYSASNTELQGQILKLPSYYRSKISVFKVPGIDISSTEIRNLVKGKASIKYLVPDEIERYIIKHNLYT